MQSQSRELVPHPYLETCIDQLNRKIGPLLVLPTDGPPLFHVRLRLVTLAP